MNDGTYSVYPNPILSRLYLELYSLEDRRLTISLEDVAGKQTQQVSNLEIKGGNLVKVDLQIVGLSNGYYILKLSSDGTLIATHKVIKQ